MKKISIVSKVAVGMSRVQYGPDETLNPLKPRSSVLKDRLKDRLDSKKYTVEVNNYEFDLYKLIEQGTDFILLSPYIKDKVYYDNIDKSQYYVLNEDEFLNYDCDSLIKHIVDNVKDN